MRNRGRISPASLSIVPVNGEPVRPAPPAYLSEQAQKTWHDIVTSMPAEWFKVETLHLLLALCKLVEGSQLTYLQMQDMIRKGLQNTEDFHKLQVLQLQQAGRLMALSTKMRLTQQSIYERSTTKRRNAPDIADAPWR